MVNQQLLGSRILAYSNSSAPAPIACTEPRTPSYAPSTRIRSTPPIHPTNTISGSKPCPHGQVTFKGHCPLLCSGLPCFIP